MGGGQLVSLITIHGRALLNGLLFDVNGLLDFTSVPLSAGTLLMLLMGQATGYHQCMLNTYKEQVETSRSISNSAPT